MHLSKEIQKQLERLGCKIKLASTIQGIFSDKNSFMYADGRNMRCEFGPTEDEFSIVLFERTEKQNYERCFARGLFNDLKRLVDVIVQWVEGGKQASEIKSQFDELELYDDFIIRNPNPEIDAAWTKVRNMFFNSLKFWERDDFNNAYLEMLDATKSFEEFENYFPFTSHYDLRFSLNKQITDTWILGIHIIPAFDAAKGRFYVSYNFQPQEGQYFESIKEALIFYAEILRSHKPLKWIS